MMKRHFVSYPKSGRSWIRYALSLLGVEKSIRFHHDTFEFNDPAKPLPIFDFSKRLDIYRKIDRVIYMYRDPRDILVSHYFQVTGRFADFFHYTGTLSDFIRDDYFGAHNLKIFQDQWDKLCLMGRAHRVDYEQCHVNFSAVLKDILIYYELQNIDDQIDIVSRQSSFEQMRKVEESGAFDEPWLRFRNGHRKVRSGKSGAYKDYFTDDDIVYLSKVFSLSH